MRTRMFRHTVFTPYNGETTIRFGWKCPGSTASPSVFHSRGNWGSGKLHPAISSVARTGTGTLLVTFADPWPMLVHASASLTGNAAYTGVITAISNVGTTSNVTMEVTTSSGGSAADIAAATGSHVFVTAVFLNSWTN